MNIVKPLISIILLIPYICTGCAISMGVTFPDNTEIYYEGWLI